jgi:hypothetical protein
LKVELLAALDGDSAIAEVPPLLATAPLNTPPPRHLDRVTECTVDIDAEEEGVRVPPRGLPDAR